MHLTSYQVQSTGSIWLQMAPKLLQMVPNDFGSGKWPWFQMIPNGSKLSTMIQHSAKWSNVFPECLKWSQRVKNGPKISNTVLNGLHWSQMVLKSLNGLYNQIQPDYCMV